MAEILIKGMEMPKDKPLNLSIYPNGEVVLFCIQGRDVYDNECNYGDYKHKKIAVEIPEPHGRLGDLDKMESAIIEEFSVWPEHCGADFAKFIKNAPTILEASEVKA